MRIYLSSKNKGKIAECEDFFENAQIISIEQLQKFDEPEENGRSFEENSMIKARSLYKFIYEKMEKDDIVLADDSGILINELGEKRLGVYTKREMLKWTVQNNKTEKDFWKHIVDEVGEGKTAEFIASISIIDYNGKEMIFNNSLKGILTYPKGNNGFGFDSIFLYDNKTLSERTPKEKQLINPRIKSLKQVAEKFNK